jgi:hypothetical protein
MIGRSAVGAMGVVHKKNGKLPIVLGDKGDNRR